MMRNRIDHLCYRIRYLPDQLTRARNKVRRLEAEMKSYRMNDILRDTWYLDDAWERELQEAQAMNTEGEE